MITFRWSRTGEWLDFFFLASADRPTACEVGVNVTEGVMAENDGSCNSACLVGWADGLQAVSKHADADRPRKPLLPCRVVPRPSE